MFLFLCECRRRNAQCNWEINLWEKSPVCRFKFKTFTFLDEKKLYFFFAILLIHISLQETWFSNKVNYLFIYSSIIHISATFFTPYTLFVFVFVFSSAHMSSIFFKPFQWLFWWWFSIHIRLVKSKFIRRVSSFYNISHHHGSMSHLIEVLRPSDWVSVRSW